MLPKKGVAHIVAIANAALRLRHFPHQWKKADVVKIPKPGKNPTFPQNYRPISLLPTLGKLFERIVHARLQEEVDELGVVPETQFGFRPRHSTTHQALRVVEHVTERFNHKEATGAVFLDISKAFDSVWHRGLLHKMLEAGISLSMVQLIRSFLIGRSFRVKLRSCRSTGRRIEAGVPQGSVLSPLLWNIFVSDLPTSPRTELALYADDTAILASSRNAGIISNRLQTAADSLEDWYTDWRISVNPEKSAAVLFQKRRLQPGPNITMFGRPIPWTNQVSYLGLLLDSKLTWRQHISSVVGKTSGAITALYPMLCRNSKLSLDNKLLLYKTVIRPVFTYASQVWAYAAKTHIHRLQVLQNKTLRMICDAPWFVTNQRIREDLQMPTLQEFFTKSAASLEAAIADHPNQQIQHLWSYDPSEPVGKHRRPKAAFQDNIQH